MKILILILAILQYIVGRRLKKDIPDKMINCAKDCYQGRIGKEPPCMVKDSCHKNSNRLTCGVNYKCHWISFNNGSCVSRYHLCDKNCVKDKENKALKCRARREGEIYTKFEL